MLSNNSNNKPIGIFDSGVGGLTVYKELKRLLPAENFVYLGDTARVPYGTKSPETVVKYALQDSLFLLDQGVKMIVVACNTASAIALDYLKERLKVPVIGVIEPGVQAALQATCNQRVGIIGTEGTIRSHVYERALQSQNPKIFCHAKATSLFVPLIEEAIQADAVLTPVFDFYLKEFCELELDTLILGCTHYPLLADKLQAYFQQNSHHETHSKIHLVDSARATAEAVKILIAQECLLRQEAAVTPDKIMVTDSPERVESIAKNFLNASLNINTLIITKVDL